MPNIPCWLLGVACLAFGLTAPLARAGDAPSDQRVSAPAVDELRALAAAQESRGERHAAAETYERLLKEDPGARRVIVPRLVGLYVALGDADAALRWARDQMSRSPAPVAYLAGVYGLLGNHAEAAALLQGELLRETVLELRLPLLWQLADLQREAGDAAAARASLEQALSLAQGTPHAAAARRRLDALDVPAVP